MTGAAVGGPAPRPATAEPFRAQVVDLLRSGALTEAGRATVAGRETVTFVGDDGHTRFEYTVEVGTYDPVRWRISPLDASGETIVDFETYELLPAGEAPPEPGP